MHYGYRKKRLFSSPLLHHAPFPKCFDCFMLTFIVPIWDKQFQIFRSPVQTPFSWSNARSLKEIFTKKSYVHNSRSAQRICAKFSTRIRQGARKHPHYNFLRGVSRAPHSGGSIFEFPWGPPLGSWKIFYLQSRRKSPYGTRRRFWVRWWGLFSLKTGFWYPITGFCHKWPIRQVASIWARLMTKNRFSKPKTNISDKRKPLIRNQHIRIVPYTEFGPNRSNLSNWPLMTKSGFWVPNCRFQRK